MNKTLWKKEMMQKSKSAMPVLSFPGHQLTGASVEMLVTDAAAQAECMVAIAKKYPMAAALGPMDLSVEAEAFGADVMRVPGEIPTITGCLLDIDSPECADDLSVPQVGDGRTGLYVEAIRLAKEKITDRPVFAGCIGPFSLAGRLMEMSNAMIACMDEPEMLETVLEKATEFIIAYIRAFKEAGADGVFMAEPAAGLLSPALNEEFSVPYVKRIVEAVKDESFLFGYHNCGPYTPRQMEDILTVGADVYHFGDAIDLDDIKGEIPGNVLFSGNVSPVDCFKIGTPDQMEQATLAVMEKCGAMANFIPSSGCDIPPDAGHEQTARFFETVAKWYREH